MYIKLRKVFVHTLLNHPVDVIEDTGTLSNHYLITFDVFVSCLQKLFLQR